MPFSLVSYYGKKNEQFAAYLNSIQEIIVQEIGNAFLPYSLEQIHGTIIGLEMEKSGHQFKSKWCEKNQKHSEPVNLKKLDEILASDAPVKNIKFGGFKKEVEYGFTSWNRHPYDRAFSIQGNTMVINGWPVEKITGSWQVKPILYQWRKTLESCHLCHKWHNGQNQDNDLFMVVGRFDPARDNQMSFQNFPHRIHQFLADHELILPMQSDDITLVQYKNPDLLPSSTIRHALPVNLSGLLHHAMD